jgi:hypothetical protein
MTAPNPAVVISAAQQTKANEDRCPWCGQPIAHARFEAIQARIAGQERQRTAQFERELRARVADEKLQAQSQAQAQVEEAKKVAAAAIAKGKLEAERQLATLKANADAALNERLRQQREAFEKAQTQAVNAEKSMAFKERQSLEKKVTDLQRQLQHKTADELGEGAELDLFDALKSAFPDDRLSRVKKGTEGADVIHEILHNNRVCGRIVFDSKNRDAWRNEYVAKLRQDQLAAHADHAVLSTRVFPAGAHQIHLQDGVIIANPARVIDLVQMLRRHVVQLDGLRLSNQERNDKEARLYEFITSDRCTQLLDQINTLAEDLLQLDVKELKAHEATWKNRGQLVRLVQKAQSSLVSEIEQITEAADSERSA